jgi:hypothetical protein
MSPQSLLAAQAAVAAYVLGPDDAGIHGTAVHGVMSAQHPLNHFDPADASWRVAVQLPPFDTPSDRAASPHATTSSDSDDSGEASDSAAKSPTPHGDASRTGESGADGRARGEAFQAEAEQGRLYGVWFVPLPTGAYEVRRMRYPSHAC